MKMRWMALFVALCLLAGCAAAEDGQARLNEGMEKALSLLDDTGLEELRVDVPGWEEPLLLKDTVRALAQGEGIDAEEAVSAALGAFFRELSGYKALMLSVLLPALLSGFLMHTLAGRKSGMDALARTACLVLILMPVVRLTIAEMARTRETIVAMTTQMERILPILLTLLTAVGGSASSAFLHPVVAAASGSMVFLAREVILRLVLATCAVTAVNHLSDRAHLTRMAQLLRDVVCWLLGVSFTVFLGAMSAQGVCSASIDGVAIRAAKYAVDSFVPVVGGMFSDTMDTLVGCTLIVKNALGVAAMILLAGAIAAPLLRTLAAVFVLKFSAALLEPLAEPETIAAIGDFARTIMLFFITTLCVGTMYFLLIVQTLLVGNLTMMLR